MAGRAIRGTERVEMRRKVVELYHGDRSLSMAKVAEQLNISVGTVSVLLTEYEAETTGVQPTQQAPAPTPTLSADSETNAIQTCYQALRVLDRRQRARVLHYLGERFTGDPDESPGT